MRIRVRDNADRESYASVEGEHETDVRNTVLIHGVTVDGGEWIAPQAIVGITVIPAPINSGDVRLP